MAYGSCLEFENEFIKKKVSLVLTFFVLYKIISYSRLLKLSWGRRLSWVLMSSIDGVLLHDAGILEIKKY